MLCERIILASASPQRSVLLRRLGIEFEVVPCGIDEPSHPPAGVVASAWSMALAYFKARYVADRHPGRCVLGADTVVWCAGELLGKPKDVCDARRMLTMQMGRESSVVTGVACVCVSCGHFDRGTGESRPLRWIGHDVTRVFMRSDAELLGEYLASGDWAGKAGAYGIQSTGERLVERVVGSFDNVVGLPSETVLRMMRAASAWTG